MRRNYSGLGTLTALIILALSACAPSKREIKTVNQTSLQQPAAKLEAMNYVLTPVRAGAERWWRIESNGQGWIRIDSPSGFTPLADTRMSHRYVFTQGQHSVNIGPEGYRALRRLFADKITGKIKPIDLTNGDLQCIIEKRDIPTGQLGWTHPEVGNFKHPFACLGLNGDEAVERYHDSWNLIAEEMVKRRQSGVRDEGMGLPSPTTPLTIDITEDHPWTGLKGHWYVAPDGKGWFELSDSITVSVGNQPRYLPKGRHAFDLGRNGAQSVRAQFEPYISGPERLQQCPERMTDQAMVRISWKSDAGQAGEYRETLGCAALAERIGNVQQIIAAQIDQ